MKPSELYVVGGAVRDVLLGLSPKDIDYVVVGSTPEEMLEMGFKQVGADFPVFLSLEGDEYALARTERKTAAGYQGFEVAYDPTVTLEDDLLRRDLTINAMAVKIDHWKMFVETKVRSFVIDPYGGLKDLHLDGHRHITLRHVSEAFAEDPLRVLRVARFHARYDGMVASETKELMTKLVQDGEIHHLTPERVWTEIEKGMEGAYAYQFIRLLSEVGALEIISPELAASIGDLAFPGMSTSDYYSQSRDQKIALLFKDMGPELVDQAMERLKAPTDVKTYCKRFAEVSTFMRMLKLAVQKPEAESIAALFDRISLYRQPEIAASVLALALKSEHFAEDTLQGVLRASEKALKITFASLSAEQQATLKGKAIAEEIARLRLEAIKTERFE